MADIHDALAAHDVDTVTRMLRHPMDNSLLYGYELFAVEARSGMMRQWRQDHADRTRDLLVRLAEALGTVALENPEGDRAGEGGTLSGEAAIARIEKVLGVTVPIRAVQHGFHGITRGDGVVTERMVHALYCAARAAHLAAGGRAQTAVLEIGAGMGYTAYYAAQLGIRRYEIVDLPMTNVAQAYFLGRALGPDRVVLEGEGLPGAASSAVSVRTPRALLEGRRRMNLVMNVDSLTEVGPNLAAHYRDRILTSAPCLLSINHEANLYTVFELFSARGATIERYPYWLREGYVEEIIRPG
jgi:hypothetical protein